MDSAKGTMMRVFNRSDQAIRHIVFWTLESGSSVQNRGHHYHLRKVETFYVVNWRLRVLLEDCETHEHAEVVVSEGTGLPLSLALLTLSYR
ncbi:MAG: hypothetical protein FJ029_06545 [Actinobacteria bacterium]|nr:hypothetical protein [Actinomycetota bacterium]